MQPFQHYQAGAAEMISRVVDDLKDENEQYRKMVVETIEKIISKLGAADIWIQEARIAAD